jgi:hypothetical protein
MGRGTNRPDPTVAPAAADRIAELEAKVASLEARQLPGSVPPHCVCGSQSGLQASHFSRGPGHMTEIKMLCPTCRASSSPRSSSSSR